MDASAYLEEDLPVFGTMTALIGISWYISIELNIRLFFTFKRRKGLYFWSCLVSSWGVLIQPLAIILADFGVWKDALGAITVIYLSWWMMVVPQSFVLYSRLHLVLSNTKRLRWVLYMVIFTTIVFSIPTMIVGILAQTSMKNLGSPYLIWDKVQLTAFFVQETVLSLIYIVETYKRLKNSAMLHRDGGNSKEVLNHLIWVNVLVIALDCSLLALSYSNLFFVQSAYKPCVYGVKLRIEFAILNRLISSIQRSSNQSYGQENGYPESSWRRKPNEVQLDTFSYRSQQSGTHMIHGGPEARGTSLDISPYDGDGIVQTTEISVQASTPKAPLSGHTVAADKWEP